MKEFNEYELKTSTREEMRALHFRLEFGLRMYRLDHYFTLLREESEAFKCTLIVITDNEKDEDALCAVLDNAVAITTNAQVTFINSKMF